MASADLDTASADLDTASADTDGIRGFGYGIHGYGYGCHPSRGRERATLADIALSRLGAKAATLART